jgi:putative transposase
VLDDFSRYIIAWRLAPNMATTDVAETLLLALDFTGVEQVDVKFRPRLLSDNGPAFISEALETFLKPYGSD